MSLFHLCITPFDFILVEGFIEAKVERFGQAIIKKVVEICNKYSLEIKTDDNIDNVSIHQSM